MIRRFGFQLPSRISVVPPLTRYVPPEFSDYRVRKLSIELVLGRIGNLDVNDDVRGHFATPLAPSPGTN
jgi:hypothetical protein